MRTRTAVRTLALSALLGALACGGEPEQAEPAGPGPLVPFPAATGPRDVAVLTIAGMGELRLELVPELAPSNVENFVQLASEGFYDGTTFHRVVPGFMIQGGDPNSRDRDPRNDGLGGPAHKVPDEFGETSFVRGTVAMANIGYPDSAGSQFFVVLEDNRELDGDFSILGRVTSGMEVADAIAAVPRDQYGRHGPPDRPMENVVIESIRIEPGGGDAATGGP